MKKTNFLKIALTLVMAFVVSGLMAQTYPADINGDYVRSTETTYQTVDLDLTLYVAPDPAYSDTYDETTNSNINLSSLWTWDLGGLVGTGSWTDNTTPYNENYVVITGAAGAGDYTITVAERIGAAGCIGSSTTQLITFLPEPSGTMVAAAGASWTEIVAGTEYSSCTDGVSDNLNLTFVEAGVLPAYAEYAYNISVTSTTYDADNNPGAVTPQADIAVAADDAGFVAATGDVAGTGALTRIGGLKTKYVFSLYEVASRTSTVSHLREGVANSFYTQGTPSVITYWLYLPPVTGPIYYIPNSVGI
jgi:hypothetical protein